MNNTAAESKETKTTTRSKQNKPAKVKQTTDGRLIGWLISFGLDQGGFAYEIRSGRSLISSTSSNDKGMLTVVHKSVSSPHAALSASSEHKVLLQDIFSDCGPYIRKPKQDSEQRVTAPTEIQHGDWVRIGAETRFQVCLIDGPSR